MNASFRNPLWTLLNSYTYNIFLRIVNNNTNDKQTSVISGVFIKGGGRITLNFIENVAVIRSFSYKTKIRNFLNLLQFTNSCLFTLDRLPLLLLLRKN